MTTLPAFIVLYLLISISIGLYAATRVKTTADYAVAGRSLPLIMVVTTTFATWFGAETVLGIPSTFVEGGLRETVEDPFGAGLCLILVGMFFAARLYRMKLLTIGDFYRHRYGRGVEMFTSVVIMISYLGWVAAQITALGLVFNLMSSGAVSIEVGMVIGTLVVLGYTVFGGMWSVALTDFVQMIIIVVGLALIAYFVAEMAGGAHNVMAYASERDLFAFWPEATLNGWLFWLSAAITLMLGSIPQQDVFQRVMSARSERIAVQGPIIGGLSYLAFAFVPMFIGLAAFVVMPDMANAFVNDGSTDGAQRILPTLVMHTMPLWLQVMFFGALLSAIMSTASATLLAPSTTFVENILKNFIPLSDRKELRAMRVTLFFFAAAVLAYALATKGTSIYEQVSNAYQFPVVGAFWPLVCGLYWRRSTTQGAIGSIVLGMSTWLLLKYTPAGEVFPEVLGGFIAAGIGMVAGSLLPTAGNRSHHQRALSARH